MKRISLKNQPSGAPFKFLLLREWRVHEVEDLIPRFIDLCTSNGDQKRSNFNPLLGREKNSLLWEITKDLLRLGYKKALDTL